jgi:hypothetical protein
MTSNREVAHTVSGTVEVRCIEFPNPLDSRDKRCDRWLQYAAAISVDAVRGHREIDLYALRLRSRRALVPNFAYGGKVWLSLRT